MVCLITCKLDLCLFLPPAHCLCVLTARLAVTIQLGPWGQLAEPNIDRNCKRRDRASLRKMLKDIKIWKQVSREKRIWSICTVECKRDRYCCFRYTVVPLTLQYDPLPCFPTTFENNCPQLIAKVCCLPLIHFVLTVLYRLKFRMRHGRNSTAIKMHYSVDFDHCLPFWHSLRWRALRWDVTWCCAPCWWFCQYFTLEQMCRWMELVLWLWWWWTYPIFLCLCVWPSQEILVFSALL